MGAGALKVDALEWQNQQALPPGFFLWVALLLVEVKLA